MGKNKLGKAPAFQFYASDFLSDINVTTMTMAQRGMYITLLAFEWIEGSLPTDILKLRILCGNHPDFDSDWQVVSSCFTNADGKLYNNRLESERSNMVAYRERMSANGRKGAESRWQGHGKAIAKPSNKEVEEEVVVKSKRTNVKKQFTDEFLNEFWTLYPRSDNRKRALDKYVMIRKSGTPKESIIDGLKNYMKYWKAKGTEPQYIPMASTWLTQERWGDELMFKNSGVQNVNVPIKQDWMCLECGHEKTTDTKELNKEEKFCSECKDGIYETKRMALLERRLIEADSTRKKNTGQQDIPTGKLKLERQTQPRNQGSSDNSSTLADVLQSFGA